jgi:hypothetical protein
MARGSSGIPFLVAAACVVLPLPAAAQWDIVYDLGVPGDETEYNLTNTPFGAGDQDNRVGPGTMTLRFESGGEEGPADGRVALLELQLTAEFLISVCPFPQFCADNMSDLDLFDRPDADRPTGTLANGVITWDLPPPALDCDVTPEDPECWLRTVGQVTCEGDLCELAGQPPIRYEDSAGNPDLRTFTFDALAPVLGGFDSPPIKTATNPPEDADVDIVFHATELSRMPVPEPGALAASLAALLTLALLALRNALPQVSRARAPIEKRRECTLHGGRGRGRGRRDGATPGGAGSA